VTLYVSAKGLGECRFAAPDRAGNDYTARAFWQVDCCELRSQFILNIVSANQLIRYIVEVEHFGIRQNPSSANSVEVVTHNIGRLSPTVIEHTVSFRLKQCELSVIE
jgi:hypothetical protein